MFTLSGWAGEPALLKPSASLGYNRESEIAQFDVAVVQEEGVG